jgi:hypothetical protein
MVPEPLCRYDWRPRMKSLIAGGNKFTAKLAPWYWLVAVEVNTPLGHLGVAQSIYVEIGDDWILRISESLYFHGRRVQASMVGCQEWTGVMIHGLENGIA